MSCFSEIATTDKPYGVISGDGYSDYATWFKTKEEALTEYKERLSYSGTRPILVKRLKVSIAVEDSDD